MVLLKIGDEVLELTWEQWEQRVSSGRVPPDSLVRFEPVTGDAWVEARTLEMYESLRNEEAIAAGSNPWDLGTTKCCALLKTQGLLGGLAAGEYDAAFGGARRDEEKSRAKERFYSFRDRFGQCRQHVIMRGIARHRLTHIN